MTNGSKRGVAGVDAQTSVESRYPDKTVKRMSLSFNKNYGRLIVGSNPLLRGFLNLGEYTNLENLECSNCDLTRLDLRGCDCLKNVNCAHNKIRSIIWPNSLANLTYLSILQNPMILREPTFLLTAPNLRNLNIGRVRVLNLGYYLSFCPNLVQLRAYNCHLSGVLEINNLTKLENLYVYKNKLSSLNITNSPNLIKLDCKNNKIFSLDFLNNLNSNRSLISLNLENNILEQQTLDCLARFTNLRWLNLNNTGVTGSLKPLRNLKLLENLHVDRTALNNDVEWLPDKIADVDNIIQILESNPIRIAAQPSRSNKFSDWKYKASDQINTFHVSENQGMGEEEEKEELVNYEQVDESNPSESVSTDNLPNLNSYSQVSSMMQVAHNSFQELYQELIDIVDIKELDNFIDENTKQNLSEQTLRAKYENVFAEIENEFGDANKLNEVVEWYKLFNDYWMELESLQQTQYVAQTEQL